MLKTANITEVYGMPVYTDEGNYYGDVEEAVLVGNRVHSWKVKATRNSQLAKVLGGARGVTIPHQLVKSVGDIMVISNSALPSMDAEISED